MILNWETAGAENGSRSFWPPHPLATVVLPHLRTKKKSLSASCLTIPQKRTHAANISPLDIYLLSRSCNDEVAIVNTRPQRFSRGDSRQGGLQWPSDRER
jgi:hypothetical protein